MTVPSTVHEGSTGPDVELAQYELGRAQLLTGSHDVDGIFGPKIAQAVREYQQNKQISIDGIVGPQTWTAMLADHPAAPTLKQGSTGPVVVRLQSFLNIAQPAAAPKLTVDGDYGPATAHAVKAYQAAKGLPDDGIVGY